MLETGDGAIGPEPLNPYGFNPAVILPYGLRVEHVRQAMSDFLDFLTFINVQLRTRQMPSLEQFLMPASFSGLVGEFMNITLPKYCAALVKNRYHNGHPDLLPKGLFPDDAVQYTHEGIEIKASRYAHRWQGHNPEAVWLMVFHFEASSASDQSRGLPPQPFHFVGVFAAKLTREDWTYAGRKGRSRRTITASINLSGLKKMQENWIYKASEQAKIDSAIPPVELT